MAEFTRGHWKCHAHGDNIFIGVSVDGVFVQEVAVCGQTDEFCEWTEQKANANLISAAPDMFAALEQAVTSMVDSGQRSQVAAVEVCMRALAKAKGESSWTLKN